MRRAGRGDVGLGNGRRIAQVLEHGNDLFVKLVSKLRIVAVELSK